MQKGSKVKKLRTSEPQPNQSGRRNTDGLLAHRQASSPQTGYYQAHRQATSFLVEKRLFQKYLKSGFSFDSI